MIEVHVREQFVSDCLDVFIIRKSDGMRALLHRGDEPFVYRWDELGPQGAALSDNILEPTFALPFDSGRALLDALTRHYQGAEDTRALRRDYNAERQRVDEQARVIADIARLLAGGSAP